MNGIKVCLATNWWQLWLHWKQWQISRVPEEVQGVPCGCTVFEVIHWEQSWLQYSKVHQGRRQYNTQSWKPFLVRWTATDCIGTVSDRIGTVTGRIGTQTTVGYAFRGKSISISLCNRRHTLSVLCFFLSQEIAADTFFSSHAKFKQFPPLFSSFFQFLLQRYSFFFGQSLKHLSADRLRCEHWRFYMVTFVRLVSHILEELGPRSKLLTKQTNFRVQPCARLAKIELLNFTSLFSPVTILLASLHETHVRGAQH